MTNDTFTHILSARLTNIVATLDKKGREYAPGNEVEVDRLQNFKIGSRYMNSTPAMTCYCYLTKHLASIEDMITGRLRLTPDLIEEKLGDAINYFILLEAILLEQMMFGRVVEVKRAKDTEVPIGRAADKAPASDDQPAKSAGIAHKFTRRRIARSAGKRTAKV